MKGKILKNKPKGNKRKKNKLSLSLNINFLYLVFIVSIFSLLQHLYNKDYESIFLFIVISIIVNFFNKNMIYILGLPFLIVSSLIILRYLFSGVKHREGFEGPMGEKYIPNFSAYNPQLLQSWFIHNLKSEKDETSDDPYKGPFYVDFDKAIIGEEDGTPYPLSLNQIIVRIKGMTIDPQNGDMDDTPLKELEEYVKNIMKDQMVLEWKEQNQKEIDYVNNRIINPLKEYLSVMNVSKPTTNEQSSQQSNEQSTNEQSTNELISETVSTAATQDENEQKNDNDIETKAANNVTEAFSKKKSAMTGMTPDFTSGQGIKDMLGDDVSSEQMLQSVEKMGPLVKESMKMLNNIDISKVDSMLGKIDSLTDKLTKISDNKTN